MKYITLVTLRLLKEMVVDSKTPIWSLNIIINMMKNQVIIYHSQLFIFSFLVQLADILNPRGIENLDSDGEDDKKGQKYPQFENNFGNSYGNNNNQHNNDEAGRVSNEHFGFN